MLFAQPRTMYGARTPGFLHALDVICTDRRHGMTRGSQPLRPETENNMLRPSKFGHIDGHCERCGLFHVVQPDLGIDFCRNLFACSTGTRPARTVVPTEEQKPLKQMKGDATMATSRHYSKTGRYVGKTVHK